MALVLAIDLGTTNLKTGVFDESGRLLCCARRQVAIERPQPYAAEHSPEKVWESVVNACREVTASYRSSISLVVVSTYQFGLILLDKEQKPVTGITTLLDSRSRQTHEEFAEWIDTEKLYQQTGCPPFSQHPLSRLFYFSKREPQVLSKAHYVLSSKAWLLYRLTGQMISDPSTEAASQMLNLNTHEWDDEVLAMIGLDRRCLPMPVDAMSEAFDLLPEFKEAVGLRAGIKVLPGVYDGGALAIGLGGLEPGVAVSNVGTSGMLRLASNKPHLDRTGHKRFQTYYLLDGRYLVGAAINNATSPLTWLKENLISDDYPEIFKLLEESSPGAGNLFFLPYLNGEREPIAGHLASGVIFGLREFHTKSHLLRSLTEGVAYSMALVKEAFDENEIRFDEIRMGGGGARFDSWVQTFANVLNAPIVRAGCEEASLCGSAIIGFTYLKEYSALPEASARMVAKGQNFAPQPELVKSYRRYIAFYKDLYWSLEGLFRKHALFSKGE